MLIGEAWGEQEARQRTAFVGPTGWLLKNLLTEAGIRVADCYMTNVFNFQPQGNKIETLCGPRDEGILGYPSLLPGKYVSYKYGPEISRLHGEIKSVEPNVVVALGNTAMWATLGKTRIGTYRGVVQLAADGYKVLPTYHPAAIFRQWNLRPVTVLDLMKARRESEYPDIRRPKRQIWIEPTLEDIHEFNRRYIQSCERLAVDIEQLERSLHASGLPQVGTSQLLFRSMTLEDQANAIGLIYIVTVRLDQLLRIFLATQRQRYSRMDFMTSAFYGEHSD